MVSSNDDINDFKNELAGMLFKMTLYSTYSVFVLQPSGKKKQDKLDTDYLLGKHDGINSFFSSLNMTYSPSVSQPIDKDILLQSINFAREVCGLRADSSYYKSGCSETFDKIQEIISPSSSWEKEQILNEINEQYSKCAKLLALSEQFLVKEGILPSRLSVNEAEIDLDGLADRAQIFFDEHPDKTLIVSQDIKRVIQFAIHWNNWKKYYEERPQKYFQKENDFGDI